MRVNSCGLYITSEMFQIFLTYHICLTFYSIADVYVLHVVQAQFIGHKTAVERLKVELAVLLLQSRGAHEPRHYSVVAEEVIPN